MFEKNLEKNLEILKKKDSLTAYRIEFSSFDQIQFCKTKEDELNLVRTRFGISDFYHSQEGARKEAEELIKNEHLDDDKKEIIFFYGLGLGYVYEPIKEWLAKSPRRKLIFLEDDLEVIFCFLHTEHAKSILEDNQVTLFHFTDRKNTTEFYSVLSQIGYTQYPLCFLVLPYYTQRYYQKAYELCYQVLQNQSLITHIHAEYLSGQSGFLRNFYLNLLEIPTASLASALFNQFRNIPAIICGAGPSLEKNIEFLKTLTDKALIFAGGSSLNIVNAYGLTPHFGVGIDPNPEQFHRLITNQGFFIPFFYRNRMNAAAFQIIQGEKIYVSGSTNEPAIWYEKALGLEGPSLDEGHNVINFGTEIARQMGCNPIIYVGMDLAFTEVKTYASGIGLHPIWLIHNDPYEHKPDPVVLDKDIYGRPIKTKWDWISESNWISGYTSLYPEVKWINATEGGIGLYPLPNMSLQETAAYYLTQTYDLHGMVHAEIQNGSLNITRLKVIQTIEEFKNSLERSLEHCNKIIHDQVTIQQSDPSTIAHRTILEEQLLSEELAFQNFLVLHDRLQNHLFDLKSSHEPKTNENRIQFLIRKYFYLKDVIEQHLFFIKEAVKRYIQSHVLIEKPLPPITSVNLEQVFYKFENNRIRIVDMDQQLDIDLTFNPTEKIDRYPTGEIKSKHYCNEKEELQGPSYFYSKDGRLLSETWFVAGQKQGISKKFYSTGHLYSLQRYKDDNLYGQQEYFYKDGAPHIIFSMENGFPHGQMLVYNTDKKLNRELNFQHGKRHGVEKMWDYKGNLILECQYHEGIPFGKAREWDPNGKLVQEVTIHQFPKDFDSYLWNDKGHLVQTYKHGVLDYGFFYSQIQEKIEYCEENIRLLLTYVESLLKEKAEGKLDQQTSEELDSLRTSIQELEKMKNELKEIYNSSQVDHEKKNQPF